MWRNLDLGSKTHQCFPKFQAALLLLHIIQKLAANLLGEKFHLVRNYKARNVAASLMMVNIWYETIIVTIMQAQTDAILRCLLLVL